MRQARLITLAFVLGGISGFFFGVQTGRVLEGRSWRRYIEQQRESVPSLFSPDRKVASSDGRD